MKKIIIAITGASGSIYAKLLFDKLQTVDIQQQTTEIAVVFSKNALDIWNHEIGDQSYLDLPFKIYTHNDFYAPFASGSAAFDTMIICPCSMGTMGRIAHGISDDLITRAADVMLKERRKLILVLRETPYNLLHINNMQTLTLAGAIICPANPSFYSQPKTINELVSTVIDRVIDLAGFQQNTYRWNEL